MCRAEVGAACVVSFLVELIYFFFNFFFFFFQAEDGIRDLIVTGVQTCALPISEYDYADHEYQVLNAHWANEQPVADIVDAIRSRVGQAPAYLTFDIDCLDPAFAPGTGTPVVGGMSSSRVLQILQGIADLNIVGFDVVEVAPAYDHAQITALAGATLALQFLYMRASRK